MADHFPRPVLQVVTATAMLIRELNGHHGSPNKITRWLKAWREARADSSTAAPMPEEKLLVLLSPVLLELTQTHISLQTATEATELATKKYEIQGVELQRVRSSLALADIQQNDSTAELTRLRTRLEESEQAASQQIAGITKLLDQQAEHHNKELARRDDQLASAAGKITGTSNKE